MENSKEVAELNEKPQDDVIEEKTDDEVRNSIIEKFSLDEDDNSELIDKLVSHEVESNKKLSTAVRQKIGWREKFNSAKPDVKLETKTEAKQDKVEISDELIQRKVDETMEKRELESLDVSDTLKTEIKNYAKLNGVSVSKAMNSSYIQFLKNEETRKSTAEDASISTTYKSKTTKNFDNMSPKDFDLSTEDGRKDFAEYKKYLSSQK